MGVAAQAKRRLIVVTGLSGSGKSHALKALEDAGVTCVDNLPVPLLEPWTQHLSHEHDHWLAAAGLDAREHAHFGSVPEALERLRDTGIQVEILFLEASDGILIQRFQETRRPHPLQGRDRTLEDAIEGERELLEPLRSRATHRMDTSDLNIHELKETVAGLLEGAGQRPRLTVSVLSFGYKHGIPPEAAWTVDVRFLPNPYWNHAFRHLSGRDAAVVDFVFAETGSQRFLVRLADMVQDLVPRYRADGRRTLVVAVGCTGGRHRSVAVADALARLLMERGVDTVVHHRDLAETP